VTAFAKALDAKVKAGKKLLVPFVTTGFPSRDATPAIVKALGDAGADVVELGVPFSDPLADGATIQRASARALQNGVRLATVLETAKAVTSAGAPPIVIMGYVNPLASYGVARFANEAGAAGVAGVIVPDLPLDEADELRDALAAANVDYVPLAAPTTTDERLKKLGRAATAFLYCVSVAGTTGARAGLPDGLAAFLERARAATKRPRLVGFGIRDPETARAAASVSDGVVVGSALLEALERAPDPAVAARDFLAPIRRALDGSHAS
jgi:tryptophan synthase alpha chain